jgi:UDP-3-O-[3-hydroxymyristoyl] glucosamine N-acyltransferase
MMKILNGENIVDNRFFKRFGSFEVKAIAEAVAGQVYGDESFLVNDLGTLKDAKEDQISFISNQKYLEDFKSSKAGVCLLEEQHLAIKPESMIAIVVANSYEAYAKVATLFYPPQEVESFIADSAVVAKSAKLADGVYIGHNVVIEEDVEIGAGSSIGHNSTILAGVVIGKNTKIAANATISHALIGDNCIIHPGVRIGQDGFGFAPSAKGILKVEQLGRVIVGNDVEIGANTCIDRGAIEDTVIQNGTKIDNLVQVAHNVRIGYSCFIAGQAGIAGSTEIGNGVMIGGQVGFAGHIKIGDRTKIAAQSGVIGELPANSMVGGSPAVPLRQWHRMTAYLKKATTKNES